MAIRNIRRQATNPLAAPGTPTSAPIYVDSDDNKLKIIPAGSGTTEVEVIDASSTQTLTNKTLTSPVITGGTINGATVIGGQFTPGAGVSSAETNKSAIVREGGVVVSSILVDLTGLHGSTTDLDIIGNTGAASANWGQITVATNGTMAGGKVTCLEVPAGGATDIDFYSAVESTGTEDTLVTALTAPTALVTSGGAWASGTTKGMTTVPVANHFLYITNGAGGAPGTFSAGKFLIEFYGV